MYDDGFKKRTVACERSVGAQEWVAPDLQCLVLEGSLERKIQAALQVVVLKSR